MLALVVTAFPLLATGLLAAIANAQVYYPDQIIELGQDTVSPLGLTENPNIQNKSVSREWAAVLGAMYSPVRTLIVTNPFLPH